MLVLVDFPAQGEILFSAGECGIVRRILKAQDWIPAMRIWKCEILNS